MDVKLYDRIFRILFRARVASLPFAECDNFVSQCGFLWDASIILYCVTRRIWSTFFSRFVQHENSIGKSDGDPLKIYALTWPSSTQEEEKEANILVENEIQCLQADTDA